MFDINFDEIDLTKQPPVEEPQRQYYFMAKARHYVQEKSRELGRDLTFCVTTFGCQMNARDSEKLVGAGYCWHYAGSVIVGHQTV